jgi:hypothetical protein
MLPAMNDEGSIHIPRAASAARFISSEETMLSDEAKRRKDSIPILPR